MYATISYEPETPTVSALRAKIIRSKSADFVSFIKPIVEKSKMVKFKGESEPKCEEVFGIPSSTYKVRSEHKLTERSRNHHRHNWSAIRGKAPISTHQSFCIKFSGGYGSGCHIGCDKNQDYTHAILLPAGEILSILCDGHGDDTVIDLIRSISEEEWQVIGKAENPMIAMEKWIQGANVETLTPGSGVCAIILRANKNGAKYWSVGDCSAFIWKSTKDKTPILVHQSQHHSAEDPLERLRLTSRPGAGITQERCMKPTPRTSIGLIGKNRPHICFDIDNIGQFDYGRVLLQPTRSCGHTMPGKESVTGGPESIKEWGFTIEPGTEYKILMYSDGIGDLVHPSERENLPIEQNAIELVNKAMSEWAGPIFVKGPCRMGGCNLSACSEGGDHGKISGGMAADDISAIMLTLGKTS